MKSIGIIAEFNPFHEGHQYMIHQAKKDTDADICVVVMSGNFVQRGEPAVYDKWRRAADAVNKGVNLVVELPTIYACSSAEYFAKGGVEILEGFGCIDYLAFGSESGNLTEMEEAAAFLKERDVQLKKRIQELAKEGHSHPKARQIAVSEMENSFGEDLLKEPNNILGIEYLKQIKTLQPHTVKRSGEGYHASASAIRQSMERENPAWFQKVDKHYWQLTVSRILQMETAQLAEIFSVDLGLAHKLKKEIRRADSMDALIDSVKSKIYTRSRLSRMMTQILLGIQKEDMLDVKNYIRVLAFDEKGSKFLKSAKKSDCCQLPVITNINKEAQRYPQISRTLSLDILAGDLYNLMTGRNLYDYSDYIMRPYSKT